MVNRYDEFGIPASTNGGRFGYTGQSWLPELGMNYYKARMYSPTLGRFMQSDPIGYGDGMNMYNYVGSDPVNKVDPTGLATICYEVQSGDATFDVIFKATADTLKCTYVPDGPANGGSNLPPAPPSPPGPPGGVPGAPQSKKLSQCMINFLESRGYSSDNLGSLTFHDGADGSLLAKLAFAHGNPAITVGNNVYVAPGNWGRISSPSGGATFFEETVHSIQWNSWGSVGFSAAYAVASGMGYYNTGDAHNNPVEKQAIALSNQLLKAYNNLPANKKCPY